MQLLLQAYLNMLSKLHYKDIILLGVSKFLYLEILRIFFYNLENNYRICGKGYILQSLCKRKLALI